MNSPISPPSASPGSARRPTEQLSVIELHDPHLQVQRGHLALGGSNPRGDRLTVNSHFLELNDRPFFPVIGEFHFARYPAAYWEESIRKMKAGGINVIASYIFWILHEPHAGDCRWSGDLDLRRFVELCAAQRVWVIVRIGPFCHGETRNGGLPDWLYGQPFEVRSNDPQYFACVDRHYARIARELNGLLFKEGGPVIGVQLENEYQHSMAPWELSYPGAIREYTVAERDRAVTHHQVTASTIVNPHVDEGRAHLRKLKEIALAHGLDVPLFTATGWGNAAILDLGCLPVASGYPYPFWSPPKPSPLYTYRDLRQEPDYSPVSYDPSLYPALSAELGPGIAVTFSRRPIVPPESVLPMIVRMLGSGANGIGYYMYHGGSTPANGGSFHEASGGLPRINYDFQAPIGEFGQLREHFRTLRLVHYFLTSFGEVLAEMATVLPPGASDRDPADVATLRYAVRATGDAGFVFLHNYQDHVALEELSSQRLEVHCGGDTIAFPHTGTFALPPAASAILPFNLSIPGCTLRSATVQPFLNLDHSGSPVCVYAMVPGLPPELVLSSADRVSDLTGLLTVRQDEGHSIVQCASDAAAQFTLGPARHLILPHALAVAALRTPDDRLAFSAADLWIEEPGLRAVVRGGNSFECEFFPPLPEGSLRVADGKALAVPPQVPGASRYRVLLPPEVPDVTVQAASTRRYVVRAPQGLGRLHDVRLRVRYRGDRVLAFIAGELVADHFFQGEAWDLGLRKFIDRLRENDMVLVFHPMHRSYAYFDDLAPEDRPTFNEGEDEFLAVDGFEVLADHTTVLTW